MIMSKKLFDYCIGNPPFQDDTQNEGDRANPLYNKFIDASIRVSDKAELIHPARFLFRAGQTPKDWENKMLSDEHYKVLSYEPDAQKIFPGKLIKGGIAVTYYDHDSNFGGIGTFTIYQEMNSIIKKISASNKNGTIDLLVTSQGLYRFNDTFFHEHPNAIKIMGKGTGNKLVSKIVPALPNVFYEGKASDSKYVRILARIDNKRTYRYIERRYLQENEFLDKYNLFIPEANGSGKYGEALANSTFGYPNDASTDTFLTVGKFNTLDEVENISKYMKTRFLRSLLGIRKVTQHCSPKVWDLIPIQDFTDHSDIDWSQSIHGIDQQLYRKYGLSNDEINFIETHVKEMD